MRVKLYVPRNLCQSLTRIAALPLSLLIMPAIDLYLLMTSRVWNEKFSAENFAKAVIAQNPRVFERLAEM